MDSQDMNEIGASGVDPLLDRARRLFGFLREVQRLRSQPVRTVDQYRQGGSVIWLHNVPEHRAIASALTLEQPAHSAPILIVDRVPPSKPPEIPDLLMEWMEGSHSNDPNGDPQPVSTRLVDGRLIRLEDQDDIRTGFGAWRRVWDSWATTERTDAPVRKLYSALFTAGEQAASSPEDLDLVLGLGLLSWRPEDAPPIQRHVVTAPISVDFAEDTGRLTVRLSEDFDTLDVELDMLDASQRPSPDHLRSFKEQAQDFGAHPLDRSAIEPLLTRFANIVSNSGMLSREFEPGLPDANSVVSLSPAIILRRRSNEGLIRIYNTIEEQLAETGEVPLGVRQLIDVVESDEDRDASTRVAVTEAFLPLPANDQQFEIIKRVDSAYHTVVQGPPGTGKTHTIANLMSHLLATGKRVLVTAQTDRALRELQEKLPEEIARLTVSVVGRSRADLADLRVAVEEISSRSARYDARDATAELERLDKRLDEFRRSKSRLEGVLLAVREQETAVRSFGTYEGTLAEIAKRLRSEKQQFEWISSFEPNQDADCPISDAMAIEWLGLLRDPEIAVDEAEASSSLPDRLRLPDPVEFEDTVDAAREARQAADGFDSFTGHPAYEPIAALPVGDRDALRSRMMSLAGTARDLGDRDEEWMSEALGDILHQRPELWMRRRDELRKRMNALKPVVDRLGPNPRVVVSGSTTADLVPLAETLAAHLHDGGRLGGLIKARPVRSAAPLIERVTVDGLPPTTEDRLQRFLDWVVAEDELETIAKLWPEDITIPDEDTHLERWAWHETETVQLEKVIALADALVAENDRLVALGVPVPDWADLEGVRRFASIVDAVVAQENARDRAAPLQQLDDYLEPLARQVGAIPVSVHVAEAVHARDINGYRRAIGRLEHLNRLSKRIARRDELGWLLTAAAPRLVAAVQGESSSPVWEGRFAAIEDAWEWYRADRWLTEQFDVDVEQTQRELAGVESRIRDTITSLTSGHAWRHAVDRLGQRERENLQAYALAVRQLGRGTGRYAAHRKNEARKALRSCRSAVPAWIMPTYRIAETLDIDPDIFDVVIIDEASQAGLDSSYLQYLAPRMVVVGDHHQVSPAGVGTEVQKLIDLTNQYLPDIDHVGIWQAPQSSLFDLARMKFGNMITLREHFRCVPEIIGFSNQLVYEPDRIPLIPLRQFGRDRLPPIRVTHVPDGYEKGTTNKINPPEAEELISAVEKCCTDPRYDGKSMGVISLTGKAQADYIEQALLERLGPLEFKARDLRCGDAAAFQGSERDVMFLSMVAAPEAGKRVHALVGDLYVQRFNVAASRAKDQMWLFHSVALDELTNRDDMRFALLNYCTEQLRHRGDETADVPDKVATDLVVDPFDSLFEQHVFNEVAKRGYIVQPQMPVYGYRIDLVVSGGEGRLAIECDGDAWHGAEQYEDDMKRQRDLERVGWTFFRVRASSFYRDPEDALAPLWEVLDRQGIRPAGWAPEHEQVPHEIREVSSPVEPPTIPELEETPPFADDDTRQLAGDPPALVVESNVADYEPPFQAVEERSKTALPSLDAPALASDSTRTSLASDEGRGVLNGPVAAAAEDSMATTHHGHRVLESYAAWEGTGFPDPRRAKPRVIAEGLSKIVEIEGPVTADRAFHLYLKGAGFDRLTRPARHALNQGLHSIRTNADVEEFSNPLTNWPQKVLRVPGTAPIRIRELGPRDLYEVPLNEIAALMDQFMSQLRPPRSSEDLMRSVLDTYGLVRLTPKVKSYLNAAIRLR